MAKEKTIKIVRTGGDSRRTDRQIATLHGLGLKKRHQVREVVDTPAVRGMITKVQHLVRVEE
jgi:large subunit ribosomal protein L30